MKTTLNISDTIMRELKITCRLILLVVLGVQFASCKNENEPTIPAVHSPPAGYVLVDLGDGAVFNMGSPLDEIGRYENEILHQVKLIRSFYICEYEVTVGEWLQTMRWDESPFSGLMLPACELTWYDALAYCDSLSLDEGLEPPYAFTSTVKDGHHIESANVTWNREANGYRLPTEAEWEFACRAGTTTAFNNGAISQTDCSPIDTVLAECGWYCGNADGRPHDVMTKRPNPLGLYDMHGNIWEWCWDWSGPYDIGAITDPTGPETGPLRVIRGGCWDRGPQICRSAARGYGPQEHPSNMIGLRLVRNAN